MHTYRLRSLLILGILILIGISCEKDQQPVPTLNILNATVNGQQLVDGMNAVPIKPTLELTFSSALNPSAFEAACTLTAATGVVPLKFSYANAGSKAILQLDSLEYSTKYQLNVAAQAIGKYEEPLAKSLNVSFTTMEKGLISEMAPCTSAGGACLQSVSLPGGGYFSFYASFPLFLENARWKNLQHAVIVLHGQNRDADLYFSYLTSALRQGSLQDNTILIAPNFRNSAEAQPGELYWSATNWRDGQPTLTPGVGNWSSFSMIDKLIERLADKAYFPAMRTIILTGHSSGALFVQLYAGANSMETTFPGLKFAYGVANTQYYYYTEDKRFDERKGAFVQPENCTAFNHWPIGYLNRPAYLTTMTKDTFNQHLIMRNITYLLGNGTSADPTLNTSDCEAIWLGPTRYKRGEYLFQWMENQYPGAHKSQKVIVQNIGHDGQGMYNSPEVNAWLKSTLK